MRECSPGKDHVAGEEQIVDEDLGEAMLLISCRYAAMLHEHTVTIDYIEAKQ